MNSKFTKPYNPTENESVIYELWEKSGYFNPDNLPNVTEGPFTIIMPPPNANGQIHAGHALFVTLEDIMIRYKRMRGFKTLWLPGTDHAGFETQVVYEKKLEKEGRSRFNLSREELYAEIMDFVQANKKATENGMRQLGASCDWSREKFTLDPDIIQTVYATFKQMSDDGLVYRGERITNWCTKHQTSLSDLETLSETRKDKLYYMQYGPLVVATVRPETMFGDVAVAVNPDDERYRQYIGQDILAQTPIGELKLKVIADEAVEKDFGTGALKITPAHDANDFEIGLRHNLPSVEVIDRYGKLNEKTGKYAGLKIEAAREAVVRDLAELGLLLKTEDYEHAVSVCYKCGRVIEPRIIPQWFVKMKNLAEQAVKAVKNKKIQIIPNHQEKVFCHWLDNIRDWNISRQIAWGIPIPAKLCEKCDYAVVDIENQKTDCPKCGGRLIKDPDTFDTWFSSGQWPYATLGYPTGEDYRNFYPTDVMETAGDIIFFWVARMVMFGLYRTGQVPFQTVYLHGLVRDAKNQKMSKSKGNVIDPAVIAEKYGTDALRMALVTGNAAGTDMALSEDRIKGYKHFANKIWNITRFILENSQDQNSPVDLVPADEKLLAEFRALTADITTDMENFRFHLASEKIYQYTWHTLADVILEESKPLIFGNNESNRLSRLLTLNIILLDLLKLLHPFMPFLTETIWQSLPQTKEKMLLTARWPE
ncbi:MAG TPA: valine--tRNA ligase [Candidatus Paceibacterota bacterium]|nr:valine--tRNA ligase [Candidatus Paceibacterota bacterium]